MQNRTPLVEKLISHAAKSPVSFHVPGHKGSTVWMKCGTSFWDKFTKYDVTELPGMDNLHSATGVIKEAQYLAAQAYGVQDTFFLVNGSTAGVLASLLAVTQPGDTVLVDRHCHSSVLNGVTLGRLKPIFIGRPVDGNTGIALSVDPVAIKRTFESSRGIKAVIITSPSYYGICSDIKTIASIAKERDAFVIVDEAHGAHLKFWDGLPESAVDCGADIVVQSAHKTLPALTQGAWLHIAGGRVDRDRLARMLGIIQTTSPSYIVMASLDIARHVMATTGGTSLKEVCGHLQGIRQRINRLGKGLFCPDREYFKQTGCYDYDNTKLIINCLGAGIDGHRLDLEFRNKNLYGELFDSANWLGIITIASKAEELDRLVEGCKEIKTKLEAGKKVLPGFYNPNFHCTMLPWQVMEREWTAVELERAEGRIAADSIVPYPPGIPLVCPGERISKEVIEHIKEYRTLDVIIKGLRGGRIQVVKKEG